MNRPMLLRRAAMPILALFCTSMFDPRAVKAETETWTITSSYPYQVQIEFYSQDRKGLAWPGSDRAYTLYDSREHTFSLSCTPGERICYGAWNVASGGRTGSKYWGVGQNNKHGCTRCCWTCGRQGEPRAINLVP